MRLRRFPPRWKRADAHDQLLLAITGVVFLATLLVPPGVRAQQPAVPVPTEREVIAELLKRVQSLEARIAELDAERAKAAGTAKPNEAMQGAPTIPAPTAHQEEDQTGMPQSGPNLRIRGFTDVTLHGSNQKGSTTSFSLGQMDLFITSDISEKFKFLSEIVFEGELESGKENIIEIDVERLLLQYSHNDYFNFAIGRYKTAIGYYNTAYHNSTWLQTAVGRPFLFEFEDGGGILPIPNVGVSASGRTPSGGLGLNYVVEVGNGRTSRSPLSEAVQNVVDENNHKAVNLALFARPEALPGLRAGFSVYRDVLAPNRSPRIGQTILAAHAVYVRPSFEWLNEALLIRHAPRGQTRVFHTPGFYTQISRRFGSYRPYFRYQYVNAAADEPIFSDVGLRHGPSVGLRYDANESVALKLQYDHTKLRQRPAIDALTLQFAFTF